MAVHKNLPGLIAATYTPLADTGELNLAQVSPMVEWLIDQGISGLYVCGSTGEGMSLSTAERKLVAGSFVQASAGRVPVLVQVGHNSLAEACELATYAESVGANIVSATCPSYFKISSVPQLVTCMAEIAGAAPNLPFYYYHIPALSGAKLDMAEFLRQGSRKIPNLTGIKFTEPSLHEFQECQELDGGRLDIVWGVDEMLLAAIATGARAAIGSTYNVYASVYHQVIDAFQRGDLVAARQFQSIANEMIRTVYRHRFHPAMKQLLGMLGHSMGPCRLPQLPLGEAEIAVLRKEIGAIGFFDRAGQSVTSVKS